MNSVNKDKMMNSGKNDTIPTWISLFCFSSCISNFDLNFSGVIDTYVMNVHKFFRLYFDSCKIEIFKMVSCEHLSHGIT